ncbi:MAG TPA: DUF5678 domain-containing protein [Blastocatellia bacterium]|nr:DUF5678 domain-containing protein [Blastocatellia bacterium]HMV83381.1 DUF5678 domain-containing protein [Blastocatellia bacterium]HMX24246.1 DUF5678 domain-containing protein [Blastocatellia bacterium]HMY70357.1 DUF5678 domain-containing protein [Blastocatellia bacterium]HMZ18555.1 DUF5678 domain-containing protein [Blastocatellia bacterium]
MSAVVIEDIMAQVNQLPAKERAKLIARLNEGEEPKYVVPEGRIIRTDAPFIDRTREDEWLREHRREYPGEWLALMGDQLIAHGAQYRAVLAEAREKGYPRALLVYVEVSDLPYISL